MFMLKRFRVVPSVVKWREQLARAHAVAAVAADAEPTDENVEVVEDEVTGGRDFLEPDEAATVEAPPPPPPVDDDAVAVRPRSSTSFYCIDPTVFQAVKQENAAVKTVRRSSEDVMCVFNPGATPADQLLHLGARRLRIFEPDMAHLPRWLEWAQRKEEQQGATLERAVVPFDVGRLFGVGRRRRPLPADALPPLPHLFPADCQPCRLASAEKSSTDAEDAVAPTFEQVEEEALMTPTAPTAEHKPNQPAKLEPASLSFFGLVAPQKQHQFVQTLILHLLHFHAGLAPQSPFRWPRLQFTTFLTATEMARLTFSQCARAKRLNKNARFWGWTFRRLFDLQAYRDDANDLVPLQAPSFAPDLPLSRMSYAKAIPTWNLCADSLYAVTIRPRQFVKLHDMAVVSPSGGRQTTADGSMSGVDLLRFFFVSRQLICKMKGATPLDQALRELCVGSDCQGELLERVGEMGLGERPLNLMCGEHLEQLYATALREHFAEDPDGPLAIRFEHFIDYPNAKFTRDGLYSSYDS